MLVDESHANEVGSRRSAQHAEVVRRGGSHKGVTGASGVRTSAAAREINTVSLCRSRKASTVCGPERGEKAGSVFEVGAEKGEGDEGGEGGEQECALLPCIRAGYTIALMLGAIAILWLQYRRQERQSEAGQHASGKVKTARQKER